jgi:cytochrome c-type biogenesis protein CcmH/NrfF
VRARRPLAALLAAAIMLALPAGALAVTIRASLTDIEADVMCVVCHEPLAVAQSPQADSERAYILMLIHRGESKARIERQLVAQYGPSVLGKPPAHGFSALLYILPPVLVAIGVAILAFTLPRWRRRAATSAAAAGPASSPALALRPGEAQRLDDELRQYGG